MQVALNLVQNVLGGSAEQDGASLGVLAFCEVSEVLVTELGDLEQTALGTNVGGGCGEDRVDDGGTGGSCDTVVVCLAYTADSCDVGLNKEMLCKIWLTLVMLLYNRLDVLTADTLFCDNEIGLQGNDRVTHSLHLLLLDLQYPVPILLFADLNVCLTFALLVLECAV